MLARGHNTERFNEGLVRLGRELENLARRNLTDQAVHAERLYLRLLNRLYGWELRSADDESPSFEAIDLYDDCAKVVVQVSVTRDRHKRDKVNATLAKDAMRGYAGSGYRLKICFVGEQGDGVKSSGAIVNPFGIDFDPKADILLASDLLARFEALDLPGQAEALRILDEETGRIAGSAHADEETVARINARLERQRRDHPSFLLMEGGPDEGLFPKGEQVPNSVRTVRADSEVVSFRDFVRESWAAGEQVHLAIAGRGGVGKTVALLSFATEEGFLPWGVPAVYVPLYDLAQLADAGAECVDRYLEREFSKPEYDAIQALSKEPWSGGPSVILLLDGHNEIPSDRAYAVDLGIRAWAGRAGTQLVATSRAAGPLGITGARRLELQGLSREAAREYLGGDAPAESDARLWRLLETPLMLRLYAGSRSRAEGELPAYVRMEEADSAGHLVWNFLQRELARVVGRHRGGFPEVEYAAALLLTLPYVCWRMEAAQEFTIDDDELDGYVSDACARWHGQDMPASFARIERRLRQRLGRADAFDLECSQRAILTDETCLIARRGDGYALMHQNFRDALAALHLRNVAEVPGSAVPQEFDEYLSEYVKDFLADLADDELLAGLWERNRVRRPTNRASTHNLLRVVHKRHDGDLSSLSFAGMDLRGINLLNCQGHGTGPIVLGENGSCFANTQVDIECFSPHGHRAMVEALSFSPDGRLLASGSDDGTVRIWDTHALECFAVLSHGHPVSGVAFSPNGGALASVSRSAIRLWDSYTGECLAEASLNERWARSIRFTAEGHLIVAESNESVVRLWDLNAGGQALELDVGSRIETVGLAPGGRLLAASTHDGRIYVWDTSNHEPLVTLRVPKGDTSISFSPDGRVLTFCTLDSQLLRAGYLAYHAVVWDNKFGRYLKCRSGWKIRGVYFTPDEKLCAIHIDDHYCVCLYNIMTGEREVKIDCDNLVRSVGQYSEGRILVVDLFDAVRVFDTLTCECVSELDTGDGAKVCVSSNLSLLAAGSRDGTIRIFDIRTCECLAVAGLDRIQVVSMQFSQDGHLLAAGYDNGIARVWDVRSGVCLITVGYDKGMAFPHLSPDGHFVAVEFCDEEECFWGVWNIHTQNRLMWPGADWRVDAAVFSPAGNLLSVCTIAGSILLWDTVRESTVSELEVDGRVGEPVFSPDGHLLAAGSDKGSVLLWDATDGRLLSIVENDGRVEKIVFSPDGSLLAIGSDADSVRLWDVNNGTLVSELEVSGGVEKVAFSPDGSLLAATSKEGVAMVWTTRTGRLRTKFGAGRHTWLVCFAPDSTLLAIGSIETDSPTGFSGLVTEDCIRVWNVPTGECLAKLDTDWERGTVSFPLTGQALVAVTQNRRVCIWDAQSHKSIAELEIEGYPTCVRFAPGGNILAAGSYWGISMWRVGTFEKMATIRTIHGIDLQNLDLSDAIMSDEDREVLLQNGVKVPPLGNSDSSYHTVDGLKRVDRSRIS